MFFAIVKKQYSTKYLYFLALTIPFKYYSTSTALPSMTQDDLNNHKIAIPNFAEQLEILNFLKIELKKFDQAIALQQTQIEKLKEYKSTLIDSAVTGKIRVSHE
jgi:type I restriction enzyme S subunit